MSTGSAGTIACTCDVWFSLAVNAAAVNASRLASHASLVALRYRYKWSFQKEAPAFVRNFRPRSTANVPDDFCQIKHVVKQVQSK